MTDVALSDLIQAVEDVPALEVTHAKISKLLTNEDATTEELAEALAEEPRLAGSVLAAANAVENRPRGAATSLVRAIVTIGFGGVQSLMTNSAVVGALKIYTGVGVPELWQRGFAAGLAARELAVRVALTDPEEAFTCGLLQQVGQIILRVRFNKVYAKVLTRVHEARFDIVAVERDVLGFSHQDVGYLVARRWRLSEPLVQVMYHHHTPEAAGGFRTQATLAHLGDVIACALGCGSDGDDYVRPLAIKKETWAALGITVEDLEPICAEVLVGFRDFGAFFQASA